MIDVRIEFNRQCKAKKGMKAELIRRCEGIATKPTVLAALKNEGEYLPVKHQKVIEVAAAMI